MRAFAISLLIIAVLPVGRYAMAADSAASLIEAVSRAASNAVTWEAEGRLVTQESADVGALQTEASFRVVIERVPVQRARIEITGVPAPVIRVCDGSSHWGQLPATKQYWTFFYPRIDVCAEPFNEWPYLATDLHEAVITGQEQLHIGEKVINCIMVRGNYAGPDASRSGKRTLWIDDVTKTIWQYRVERGTAGFAGSAEPAARVYTLLRQTSGGARQPSDFVFQAPEGWERPSQIPALRLGDGAPVPGVNHAEPGGGLYRVGNGVRPPVVIRKVPPKYTAAARDASLEGRVVLYAEVWPDGAAHNIKVVRSLEPGLDQKAIEAVGKWKFRPGTKDGVPVKVAATFEVNFRLR
jgi:TonB family protein